MSTLRLVLADQLSDSLPSLKDADKKHDTIMLCEVMEEATYVPHHPKKIAFLFAAMRHFSKKLQEQGFTVRYVQLDDEKNSGSLESEILRATDELKPKKSS